MDIYTEPYTWYTRSLYLLPVYTPGYTHASWHWQNLQLQVTLWQLPDKTAIMPSRAATGPKIPWFLIPEYYLYTYLITIRSFLHTLKSFREKSTPRTNGNTPVSAIFVYIACMERSISYQQYADMHTAQLVGSSQPQAGPGGRGGNQQAMQCGRYVGPTNSY